MNVKTPYWMSGFQKILAELEKRILEIVNCKGKVFFLTSAGIGAMDAVVSNFIDDKTLVINSGMYGEKWLEICKFYGVNTINFLVNRGENIDFKLLEETIKKEKPKFILTQHVETSTGQKHDLDKIGALCKREGIYLFVDAISSFLAEEYDADRFGADITIINPKKGVGTAPGISIVVLRKRIPSRSRSYYFNFDSYGKEFKIPYTPDTDLLLELHEKLRCDPAEKIEKTRKLAEHFRRLIKDLPLKMIAESPANGYTVVQAWADADMLFDKICCKKNYFSPFNRWTLIIPHLENSFGGPRSEEDNKKLMEELKKWIS